MVVAVVGWKTKCCISHLCKTSRKCPPGNAAVARPSRKRSFHKVSRSLTLLLRGHFFFLFVVFFLPDVPISTVILEEYVLFIFIEFEFFVYWFYGDVQLVLYLKVPLQLGTTATITNKFIIYFFIVFLLGVGGGKLVSSCW